MMPIALGALFKTFNGGVKKIESLADVLERGATVLARQRGAFLVGWFGPDLPTKGLAVQANIVNSDAIFAKIQHARILQQDQRRQQLKANLFEPLMGAGGVLIGAVVGNVVGGGARGGHTVGLIGAIGSPAAPLVGLIVGASVGALVLVGGAIVGLLWYLRKDDESPASGSSTSLVESGGQYADMVQDWLTRGEELLGDHSQVEDPVRRGMLVLGDKLAAVMAKALAAMAVFLPVIVTLRPLVEPFKMLVASVVDAARAVLTSLLELDLPTLVMRPISVITSFIPSREEFFAWLKTIKAHIGEGMKELAAPFSTLGGSIRSVWAAKKQQFEDYVNSFPLVQMVRNLGALGPGLTAFGAGLRSLLGRIGSRITPRPIGAVMDIASWLASKLGGSSSTPPPAGPSMAARLHSLAQNVPSYARITQRLNQLQGIASTAPTPATPTAAAAIGTIAQAEFADRGFLVIGHVHRVVGDQAAAARRRGRAALLAPETVVSTAMIENAARLAGLDRHVEDAWGMLATYERPLGRLPDLDVPRPKRIVPVIGTLKVKAASDTLTDAEVRAWAMELGPKIGSQAVAIPADTSY